MHVSLNELLKIEIVGSHSTRLAGTTMLVLPEIPIDFLFMGLDEAHITASTGTSCKSQSRSPSPGLMALGLSEAQALQVVRFSYNECFSPEEQSYVLKALKDIVRKLR